MGARDRVPNPMSNKKISALPKLSFPFSKVEALAMGYQDVSISGPWWPESKISTLKQQWQQQQKQ